MFLGDECIDLLEAVGRLVPGSFSCSALQQNSSGLLEWNQTRNIHTLSSLSSKIGWRFGSLHHAHPLRTVSQVGYLGRYWFTSINEYWSAPGSTTRTWGHFRPVAYRWVKYLPSLWVFGTFAAMSLLLRFARTCCRSRHFCPQMKKGVDREGEGDFVGSPYFSLSSSGFLLGSASLYGYFWGRGRQGWNCFRLFLLFQFFWGFKEGLSTLPANLCPAAVVLVEQAFYSAPPYCQSSRVSR